MNNYKYLGEKEEIIPIWNGMIWLSMKLEDQEKENN